MHGSNIIVNPLKGNQGEKEVGGEDPDPKKN
jgi:hypothetical protein